MLHHHRQELHLRRRPSQEDAYHRQGRHRSCHTGRFAKTTLSLWLCCCCCCCCWLFAFGGCHVTLAQDPLYHQKQQQRGRRGVGVGVGSRSMLDAIANISQRRQQRRSANVYQPDWSSRFLSEAEWKADERARLYRVNSHRKPNLTLSWTNRLVWFNILAFAAQAFFPSITSWGVKLSDKILRGQQLYRLVTPMFLHGGIAHLFTNMYSLQNVGPDLERLVGSDRLVLTYLISGVAGNYVSALCSPNPSLGASGAVFGMVAAYYVFFLRNEWMLGRWGLQMQQAITQSIALNLILGALNPMVDQWGHVGGAIGGAAVGYFMGPRLYLSQNNHQTVVIDRPHLRIPRWIEVIPHSLSQQWTRVSKILSNNRMAPRFNLPFKQDLPWRQEQRQQQQAQQQRRKRQNAPNRSIKPRWF